MIIKKQYARRNIAGYESPYHDPFEYRPIADISQPEFFQILSEVVEVKPFMESKPERLARAEKEFFEWVEYAGLVYEPKHWYLAYLQGEPAGVIFPQRYWDKMEEGSIFHIGILPRFQGNGYGKILHAKSLETLAKMGVTSYVGSTGVSNERMIAVFLANDCTLTKIHTLEVDESGEQRIIA
ncbi:MAG TPA: GNAT family N-acetyltransferase [Candidatus Kapabacteria bacterium]|jgi:ribosomal protein S18 acetylase RimI-like enzyme|nr:GNAT family N-acetyltransferase [Candidatus Kapabacteria bacterium]